MLAQGIQLGLLLLAAFLPAIILAIRLRNAEQHRREPWRALALSFLWGATLAALLAILISLAIDRFVLGGGAFAAGLSVATIVVAPVVEETVKALGLYRIRSNQPEPEDGYIYGGAVGLGFAATENVLYITNAYLLSGQEFAAVTALYRGIATTALHGAASAVAGYGVWQSRYGGPKLAVVAALVTAIVLHATYNYVSDLTLRGAALAAAGLALIVYMQIVRRVRVLDEQSEAR